MEDVIVRWQTVQESVLMYAAFEEARNQIKIETLSFELATQLFSFFFFLRVWGSTGL